MPLAGSWWAVYRTAERAKFMLDNYVAMSNYGQLITEKFPNSQKANYLKQAQQCHGS
jgi:hypothetical protein